MKTTKTLEFDHLIIGSGLAGLNTALALAATGRRVGVLTKRSVEDCNTRCAQGGIACVTDIEDSFEEHLQDTLTAGGRLCDPQAAMTIIEAGPAAVQELIEIGTRFTTRGELGYEQDSEAFDLGREGGHHKRRVLHAGDITGAEIERALIAACRGKDNITFFEYHTAIDLIMTGHFGLPGKNRCCGAYALDSAGNVVKTFLAASVTIACGGIGKVYLYTSNPDISCGSGVAMGYRAGATIANMEFIQFHPTILYHPTERSFLISEALRGEGAVLKYRDANGDYCEFMDKYHPMKSLAPRDVVARAIDNEMKRTGAECVYLDITHLPEEKLRMRFPNIFQRCLDAGINMAEEPIPVVPAAHFLCGGVKTDVHGFTGITGLYAVGESGCTGLHGANRLASNSLLEAAVVSKASARHIDEHYAELDRQRLTPAEAPVWVCGNATDSDERVLISHNWDEIRRFMWDYVGIFRTNKRLERAQARIRLLRKEIEKYYWDFLITSDLIELRNIATVAELIIESALRRHESRGLNYNADYPYLDPELDGKDTYIKRNF